MSIKVVVKKNSRWGKGGQRYDAKARDEIDKKYREQKGWRHGARVRRVA
jgi:hypothetical protein